MWILVVCMSIHTHQSSFIDDCCIHQRLITPSFLHVQVINSSLSQTWHELYCKDAGFSLQYMKESQYSLQSVEFYHFSNYTSCHLRTEGLLIRLKKNTRKDLKGCTKPTLTQAAVLEETEKILCNWSHLLITCLSTYLFVSGRRLTQTTFFTTPLMRSEKFIFWEWLKPK